MFRLIINSFILHSFNLVLPLTSVFKNKIHYIDLCLPLFLCSPLIVNGYKSSNIWAVVWQSRTEVCATLTWGTGISNLKLDHFFPVWKTPEWEPTCASVQRARRTQSPALTKSRRQPKTFLNFLYFIRDSWFYNLPIKNIKYRLIYTYISI